MTTQIHRIADKAPEFPCWLYYHGSNGAGNLYAYWTHALNEGCKIMAENGEDAGYFTHWHPDQPLAPTATPPTEQATEGSGNWRDTHPEIVSEHREIFHAPAPAVAEGETPRTDAAIVSMPYAELPGGEIKIAEHVRAGFARQLERELNAAKDNYAQTLLASIKLEGVIATLRQQLAAVTQSRDEFYARLAEVLPLVKGGDLVDAARAVVFRLAQVEAERDQARQDLEERCAENDRERLDWLDVLFESYDEWEAFVSAYPETVNLRAAIDAARNQQENRE